MAWVLIVYLHLHNCRNSNNSYQKLVGCGNRCCSALFLNIFLFLESELTSGIHIGIPWQSGLKRGSALEADGDSILVREAGFYFVYSQVGPMAVIPQSLHRVVLLLCLPITRFLRGE